MAKKKYRNRLLVPVDFTPFSKTALFFASELAGELKAQLLVLHVIHDPLDAPGFYAQKGKKKKYLKTMEEAAAEMMQEFFVKIRKVRPDNIPIREAIPILIVGTPVSRIVEIAEQKKVRMIIIGSHGRTRLSNLLLGSKAEQVVRLSSVPVTVVKSPRKERP